MKKILTLFILSILLLTGCGSKEPDLIIEPKNETIYINGEDRCLKLQSLFNNYYKHIGQRVHIKGTLDRQYGPDTTYYAVVIKDANNIKALEFITSEDLSLTPIGTPITVEGTFTTYKEANNLYCTLQYTTIQLGEN